MKSDTQHATVTNCHKIILFDYNHLWICETLAKTCHKTENSIYNSLLYRNSFIFHIRINDLLEVYNSGKLCVNFHTITFVYCRTNRILAKFESPTRATNTVPLHLYGMCVWKLLRENCNAQEHPHYS